MEHRRSEICARSRSCTSSETIGELPPLPIIATKKSSGKISTRYGHARQPAAQRWASPVTLALACPAIASGRVRLCHRLLQFGKGLFDILGHPS